MAFPLEKEKRYICYFFFSAVYLYSTLYKKKVLFFAFQGVYKQS